MSKKPFDLLSEFSKFGLERQLSLHEPQTIAAFGAHVTEAIQGAMGDPILLHGQRVEAMFESLVMSLGCFRLLKPEDGGRVFPDVRFRVPDFRVVLMDGRQWLIEVKNVYLADPFDQRRSLLSRRYLGRLQAYAEATRAELKLAVYWARWAMWTLVTPHRFVDSNGDVALDMLSAHRGSELAALGDCSIGTRPPLRLRLVMDPSQTTMIGPSGRVRCVIGGASLFCDQVEIADEVEQQIAWLLIQHGEWAERGAVPVVEGDRLVAVEFRWEPDERSNNGFEIIGSLSRMFARFFADATIKDGEVAQLRAPTRPEWFGPLITPGYRGGSLPLWRFALRPSYANAGRPVA